MAETSKLLPCPFCGGAPLMEILGGPRSTYRTIRCSVCRCDLHFYPTEQAAEAAWNTRAVIRHDDLRWAGVINLTPEAFAAFEGAGRIQEGTRPGTCRHCGCTNDRACRLEVGGVPGRRPTMACNWVDASHIVCSNPVCVAKEAMRITRAADAAAAAVPR